MTTKVRLIAVLIVGALILSACATSPTGRRQLMLVSEEKAIAASEEAYLAQMKDLDRKGKLVTDPRVVGRIDRITGRLVAQAIKVRPETADWSWSVEVIDDPKMVNAWCMAGGRMAIYTGLLQQLDATDDEVAQVMGHEIAHALANHTAERMSVAMASKVVAIGGGIALGSATDKPLLGLSAAAAASQLAITLPNSRTSESEADEIGIELAAKAGYDPRAAVTLWQKMGRVGGGGPPQFLSTHPSSATRQQDLAALVPEMMPYYQNGGERPSYDLRK
ncbi:MAG: M48 family metallopeptidase [Rhodospirillales bacterium]|nr:M48 family metallopeptidase [Rhodospirillales bacterium]